MIPSGAHAGLACSRKAHRGYLVLVCAGEQDGNTLARSNVRAAEQGYLFLPGVLPTRLLDPVRTLVRDQCVGYGLRYVARSLSAGSSLLSSDARLKGR